MEYVDHMKLASRTDSLRTVMQFVHVLVGRLVPQERIRNAQWRSLRTSQSLPVKHYNVEGSLEFRPVQTQVVRPPRFFTDCCGGLVPGW